MLWFLCDGYNGLQFQLLGTALIVTVWAINGGRCHQSRGMLYVIDHWEHRIDLWQPATLLADAAAGGIPIACRGWLHDQMF